MFDFSDCSIYIPTYKRSHRQKTFHEFPNSVKKFTYLVVDHSERKVYKQYKKNMLVCPSEIKGITPKLKWILENAKTRYILILDDDLRLFRRKPNSKPARFKHCNRKRCKEIVTILFKWLKQDKIRHVGLSYRPNAYNNPEHFEENVRCPGAVGYDRKIVFEKCKITYDNNLAFLSDLDVTLRLLKKGIKNRVLLDFCYNQTTNSSGGCSTFRTFETQSVAAEYFSKKHPDFVKLVIRKPKVPWGKITERKDVRVSWQKAYQYGLKRREERKLVAK